MTDREHPRGHCGLVPLDREGPAVFRHPDIVQIPIRNLLSVPIRLIWCRT